MNLVPACAQDLIRIHKMVDPKDEKAGLYYTRLYPTDYMGLFHWLEMIFECTWLQLWNSFVRRRWTRDAKEIEYPMYARALRDKRGARNSAGRLVIGIWKGQSWPHQDYVTTNHIKDASHQIGWNVGTRAATSHAIFILKRNGTVSFFWSIVAASKHQL